MSVSVITPMYNEALNIEKCYRTLCKQKNIKFEWVIIDDGSTDNSVEIVKNIIDSHVSDNFDIILIKQDNAGAAEARKNGIDNCRYNVISILDADDQLSECALESAFAKMSPSIDFVCYRLHYIDEAGTFLSKFKYTPAEWPVLGKEAFAQCINGWGLTGCSMIKKSLLLNAYEIVYKQAKDNTVNLDELISRVCMFNSNEIDICDGIYYYYNNPNSTTRKKNKDYYKIIYTALLLNDFVLKNCNESEMTKSNEYMFSTLIDVYLRYRKWHAELENKNDWCEAMELISKNIAPLKMNLKNIKLKALIKRCINTAMFFYIVRGLIKK